MGGSRTLRSFSRCPVCSHHTKLTGVCHAVPGPAAQPATALPSCLPLPVRPAPAPAACFFAMTNSLFRFTLSFFKDGALDSRSSESLWSPRRSSFPCIAAECGAGQSWRGHHGGLCRPLPLCWELFLLQPGVGIGPGSIPAGSELPPLLWQCPDPQIRWWQVPMSPPGSKGGHTACPLPDPSHGSNPSVGDQPLWDLFPAPPAPALSPPGAGSTRCWLNLRPAVPVRAVKKLSFERKCCFFLLVLLWFCFGLHREGPSSAQPWFAHLICFGKFNFSMFLFNPNPRELVLMFEHLHRVHNGGFRNSEVKKLPDGAPPPYHSFTPGQKSIIPAACSGER